MNAEQKEQDRKQRARAYYEQHKEAIRQKSLERSRSEKGKERSKAYYQKNKETLKARSKEYYHRHKAELAHCKAELKKHES